MTETGISSSVGIGGPINPVDWGYSPPTFNTADSLRKDTSSFYYDDHDDSEDDLDSYYMDLPPIDMTERLKEVNRALAEDSTPVDSNRVTKLRFKEVIAEFQSPRESDSDDGYGDSSDIMCDPDEENDILHHTSPCKNKCDDADQIHNSKNESEIKSSPFTIQSKDSDQSDESKGQINGVKGFALTNSVIFPDVKGQPAAVTSTRLPENVSEVVMQILEHETDTEEDEEIIEEIVGESSAQSANSNTLTENSGLVSTVSSEEDKSNPSESKLIPSEKSKEQSPKLFEHSRSNGRFSKCYKKDLDLSELDSDIDEEIDAFINETYMRRGSLSEESVEEIESNNVQKYETSFTVKAKQKQKEGWDQPTTEPDLLNNDTPLYKKSTNIDLPTNSINLENNMDNRIDSDSSKPKATLDDTEKSKKAKRSSVSKSISDQSYSRTSKSALENILSKSQPIPTIKSSLISQDKLQLSSLKNSRGLRASVQSHVITPASNRYSRNRSTVVSQSNSNGSPTKSPLTNPIQSTRSHTSRKGSPLPRRKTKLSSQKPLKAVHNETTLNNSSYVDYYPSNPLLKPSSGRVRKAASTSDLCSGGLEDQRVRTESVYERWLQEKTRNAAAKKRKQDEAKITEEIEANAKLQERRKLAEEAFQQWLRRKREQIKEEKRMRAQQRKLEHHSSYARTRAQCEDAYKE